MKKKQTPSQLKAKATDLHAKLVRSRGRCESCGTTQNLQCAHIVSRRFSNTRTDLDNAFCLCAREHLRFTEWPYEFVAFVVSKIGEDGYRALRDKAMSTAKVDWDAELLRLKALARERGVAA